MPPRDQIFMGMAVALCCLAGLRWQRSFLSHTSKGQWLVRRLGDSGALWVLRLLLIGGVLLGGLLATGLIHPLQWD